MYVIDMFSDKDRDFLNNVKPVSESADSTVTFEIDSENAYNQVMKQFGSVISWDGDSMVAPRKYWGSIQELAANASGAALEVGAESVEEAGAPFRGVGGAFNRGDDEHHEIDRAREQQAQTGTWYIRINDKILKTRDGQPYTFYGKAAANKAALTMQAKPFNANKKFTLTTSPDDKESGVTEMDKSQTPPGRGGHVSHSTYGSRDKKDPDAGKKQYTAKGITANQATNVATGILSKAFKDSQRVDPRTSKKMVQKGVAEGGEPEQQESPVVNAITRRILMQRTDLLAKYGPDLVGQAVDEVADFVGDVEEIGSSDVSGWVRHVEQMLGNMRSDDTKDVTEGRVKELGMDLRTLTDSEFLAKYKKTKAEVRASMKSKVEESSTESRPRIRKFTSMRPDGSKTARYEVLDYMGRRVGNAFDDLKFAKQYFYRNYDKLASLDEDVSNNNPTDTVTMDVPLLIRVMEFAREDAQTDMDLHDVAEKLISLSASGEALGMDSYNQIVPSKTDAMDADHAEPTIREGGSRAWSSTEKRWVDQ